MWKQKPHNGLGKPYQYQPKNIKYIVNYIRNIKFYNLYADQNSAKLLYRLILTPAKFCSQMKHSTCRSGKTFLKFWEKVEFFMSPSKATTRSLFLAILTRALPYAARVAKDSPMIEMKHL